MKKADSSAEGAEEEEDQKRIYGYGSDFIIAAPPGAMEDLSRKRKQVHTTRLSELDKLSETIQHEETISLEERQRKMGIVYSRRKRVRQNQRIDELTETCVSFRESNVQLSAENKRLEALLAQAEDMVKEAKGSSGSAAADSAPPFDLASTTDPMQSLQAQHNLSSDGSTNIPPFAGHPFQPAGLLSAGYQGAHLPGTVGMAPSMSWLSMNQHLPLPFYQQNLPPFSHGGPSQYDLGLLSAPGLLNQYPNWLPNAGLGQPTLPLGPLGHQLDLRLGQVA
jgi:hypothetical protein